MNERPIPFKSLGDHLRYLRQQSRESIAEVSGAVEIDEPSLQRIEDGHERPAEDILLLLINHYNMREQDAVQLWGLAGYDGAPEAAGQIGLDETMQAAQKAVIMFLAHDNRVMYSDQFEMHIDGAGVTLRFAQQAGDKKQPVTISQIGMSYEQAERVLQAMQYGLLQAKYVTNQKRLPPPKG